MLRNVRMFLLKLRTVNGIFACLPPVGTPSDLGSEVEELLESFPYQTTV